jgi:outer membrane lipoprotein-sorting protein
MFPAGLLLPDFDLQITGRTEFLGRPVIAISGSPRLAGRARHERVTGLVDAELGILLRYQRAGPAQTDSAEFTRLTVSPAQPPGREQDPGPLPGACPSGRNSIGQEDPVFTDHEVNLLYRSDLGRQRFTALLSEQTDAATMMRLAREAFAATNVGNRTQWLWRPYGDHAFQDVDRSVRLAVAMPGRYLIEAITDPGRKPAVIACNGQQLWRAYPDRVAVRTAEPVPREITTIIDPAWLLDEWYQVSVLGEAVVDGRPALHVRAAGDWLPPQSGPLSGTPVFSDQVEVFIDRELGICLRQVSSCQGHPVLRTELTGLTTEADPALFDFTPPPGMKVITGGLLAEWGQTPASIALHAAKGAAGLAVELGRRWLNRNDPAEPGR